MKRKRKESCPSPILDDSPKRTKVQAQRKFAQNSGMHSPIMSPIRDLETADLLPHATSVPDPVELLPMKRPNTEDFLTFLCFRGTPILPPNLQFFNAASIVTDGQVHEIKGDSPKNGPIDISKCAGAGTSSDKPFIAFGVRKRADPIVISRQMERKRRHALAIQALRRKYQEQKMAKIRALTISKLSEKTTNKTLVKTNTIQKTETVTKKTNTLQKTKVIATKHVKVTTQTLKTKVKPKIGLRSLRGKAVQKELPFRNRRALQERENAKKLAKSYVRTSKNSNKAEGTLVKKKMKPVTATVSSKPVKRIADVNKTIKVSSSARVTRSGSVTTVVRKPSVSVISKRPQVKRRILLPTTTTVGVLKPKLRSTTTKKTVISRKKALQRTKPKEASPNKVSAAENAGKKEKDTSKKVQEKETTVKKVQEKETVKNASGEGAMKSTDNPRRLTRKDSEVALKSVPDKGEVKKEVTKSLDLKKEVRIAETTASKEVKKNVNLKKEYRLKSTSKDVKKNVDLKKTSSTISERNEAGQKVKRDVKTVEMTVKKVVTRKTDGSKQKEPSSTEEKTKDSRRSSRSTTQEDKEVDSNKKSPRNVNKSSKAAEKNEIIEAVSTKRPVQAAASANKSPVRTLKKKQQEKVDLDSVKPPAVKSDKEINPLEGNPVVEKKEPVDSSEKKQQRREPLIKQVSKEISSAETNVKKEEDKKSVLNEKADIKKPIVEEVKLKTAGIMSVVKKVTKKEVPEKSTSDNFDKEKTETKKSSVFKPIKNALKGTLKLKKNVKESQVTPAKSNIETAPSNVLDAEVQLGFAENSSKSTEKSLVTDILPLSQEKPLDEKIKESVSKDDKTVSKNSIKKAADKASCKEASLVPNTLLLSEEKPLAEKIKELVSKDDKLASKKSIKKAVDKASCKEASLVPNIVPLSEEKPLAEKIKELVSKDDKLASKKSIKKAVDKASCKEASLVPNIVPLSEEKPLAEKIKELVSKDDKLASKKSIKKAADKASCKEASLVPNIVPLSEEKPLAEKIKELVSKDDKLASKKSIKKAADKASCKEASLVPNILPLSEEKLLAGKIKELVSKDNKLVSKKSIKKAADKASGKEVVKPNIVRPETVNEPSLTPKKTAEKEIITPKKVIKESVAKNPPKKEGTNKTLTDSESDKKNSKEQLVDNKKKDLTVKNVAKEEAPKRKSTPKRDEPEQVVQKASPRPSRKTKEAAAIYMEILSHKLVNDSIIDDDNVSIDSFPELPNVKKTEQREIELKAQAKTSKEEDNNSVFAVDEKKVKKVSKIKKDASEGVDDGKHETSSLDVELKKYVIEKGSGEVKSPLSNKDKIGSHDALDKGCAIKSSLGKRKSNSITQASDSDSDNEVLLAKIRKSEAQKNSQRDGLGDKQEKMKEKQIEVAKTPPGEAGEPPAKRQTRRATQAVKESDSDSSDESFRVDVRVPKKKKNTRSQNKGGSLASVSVLEKNVDIILEAARVLEGEGILELKNDNPGDLDNAKKVEEQPITPLVKDQPEKLKALKKSEVLIKDSNKTKACPDVSDSDESTTSDINLKSLQARQRNKKLSKTKSNKSSAAGFSDSDEEPLSKLTSKVATAIEDVKKKPPRPKPVSKKPIADKNPAEPAIIEPKPKRECTKRPSNYLPMLSSSDEEDEPFFHGFNTITKEVTTNEPEPFVQTLAPSLEFLNKDIGRKGKVNMSNEQIEQWLKDSALAGSSVAKENDEMLKFGEKIPVENSTKTTELKLSETREVKTLVPGPVIEEKPVKMGGELKSPLMADRKWIFKKDKKEQAPNKNAFSPENECSVYAFGEENEELISTPFRRPSRRPSSTATSRSEDELSKNDESIKQGQFRKPGLLPSDSEDSRCFPIPQNPTTKHLKTSKTESMVPPSTTCPGKRAAKPTLDRFPPEPFDDFKYKIPSSPSASSGSSAKPYKKGAGGQKQKGKVWEAIAPVYVSDFPKTTDLPKMVEAPVFHPTDQEFQDPLEYIERIRHKAEQFGICKIVPPSSFKPECKVSDDMRFTAYNQYVHKMLHRWGPNFKEFMVIRKYLATQNIPLKSPPLIGGMEIDLPRLYQTVQSLGGLKEVIEKKKWSKVSDHMKIPKLAQDRVTKLDDIYCKYLLPYDTLSPAEREKLFDEVETHWAKKESKNMQLKSDARAEIKPAPADDASEHEDYESDDNETTEECTVKSKTMALNAFYRIARNTMSMYFKVAEPTAQEVEQEFWRYVIQKQNHICVHSASIDCGSWGYGFAVSKNSPFARHPWNLKAMSNNSGSVLRSLGPVMGVTIPTLHVGMVFSTCCWYRDPHGLPWVEYLHTGGSKIWYGIPSASCDVFQAAMRRLVPNYCRDKELWLPSDTAMVPPGLLMEHNVSLCRTVQEPGQFLVVFPKVYTSSISTGYVVSESVYFAPLYWLRTARNLFNGLKNSCEPSMFSLDKLLISIAMDARSSVEVLRVIIPFMEEIYTKERDNRMRLRNFGKIEEEKITNSEISSKKKKMQNVEDFECEVCRTNLYVSMVIDTQDDLIYCLEHAIELVAKNGQIIERFQLRYAFDEAELQVVPAKIKAAIEAKLQKKVPGKYAGLPTMLK